VTSIRTPRVALVAVSLALAAVVLAGAAIWAALDNPTVVVRGETHQCAAPYDSVLNGADEDNAFGGLRPYPQQIAARCHQANQDRVTLAVGLGVAALLAAIAAAVTGIRAARPRGNALADASVA
jgi:hypothetical protein